MKFRLIPKKKSHLRFVVLLVCLLCAIGFSALLSVILVESTRWSLSTCNATTCLAPTTAELEVRLYTHSINVMLLVTACISFLGSSFMFVVGACAASMRGPLASGVIKWMSFFDALFAAKFILSASLGLCGDTSIVNDYRTSTDNVTAMCFLSAWLGQFFGLGSISWNFVIAVYLFFMVWDPAGFSKARRWLIVRLSHVFVWCFALLTCLIAHASSAITFTDDGTCWLSGNFVLFFYVPFYVYFVTSLIVLIFVAYKLKHINHKLQVHEAASREVLLC